MTTRYLLVHNTHGVYLGSCMGLGFWSKMEDCGGQDEACTFSSVKAAFDCMNSWDTKMEISPVPAKIMLPSDQINADGSAYATKLQVIDVCGTQIWKPS